MKYFSLFTGIGGFELGIQQAYDSKYSKGVQQGVTNEDVSPDRKPLVGEKPLCVGYSEIDKYAIKIYQSHFPTNTNYGDITKINANTFPDFDLLCGGFPCQAFSVAGKRRGFDDTRGTLFFDICRLAKAKRPRLLLLENVKGLLNHDRGQTFRVILSSLDELGYDCQWQVCNSKDFGVPQNRERVIIVGHLRGTPRPEVFPLEGTDGKNLEYIGAVLSEKNRKWLDDGKQFSRNFPQGQRIYSTNGIASTLSSNAGGLGGKTGLYSIKQGTRKMRGPNHVPMEVAYATSHQPVRVGQGLQPTITRQPKIVRQPLRYLNRNQKNYEGDYAFTVDSSQTAGVRTGMQIRRLTPTECERLQGFPDGWTAGVSDTQRYKTLGNAVTVNVIKVIASALLTTNR